MSSKTTDDKRVLKLSISKDWDVWLAVYSAKIIDFKIWNIIDSIKKIKSIDSTRSIASNLDAMTEVDFNKKYARFKIAALEYKENFKDWKNKDDVIKKIIEHIYDIISVSNLIYIEKIKIYL